MLTMVSHLVDLLEPLHFTITKEWVITQQKFWNFTWNKIYEMISIRSMSFSIHHFSAYTNNYLCLECFLLELPCATIAHRTKSLHLKMIDEKILQKALIKIKLNSILCILRYMATSYENSYSCFYLDILWTLGDHPIIVWTLSYENV